MNHFIIAPVVLPALIGGLIILWMRHDMLLQRVFSTAGSAILLGVALYLAYYASSRLQSGLGPASWQVSTGVAPDKAEQAIASIRAEIRRMQDEPVTEEELADCQAYRTGSLPVSLETNDGLSDIIMNIEYLGLGDDYLQRFPAIINSVTVADIQRVAQTWLDPDAFILALAGPPEGEG